MTPSVSCHLLYKKPLKYYGHSYEHQSNIGTDGKDFYMFFENVDDKVFQKERYLKLFTMK